MSANSNFDASAKSKNSKGEDRKGLMGLSDKTLIENKASYAWEDGDSNARVGTKYLSELMKYYGNDIEKALAAYYNTQAEVDANITKYGSKWNKHLDNDTEEYLAKVLKTYSEL